MYFRFYKLDWYLFYGGTGRESGNSRTTDSRGTTIELSNFRIDPQFIAIAYFLDSRIPTRQLRIIKVYWDKSCAD